jgi:carbonic anhydrase
MIAPAIQGAANSPGNRLENAVKMNVVAVVKQLNQSDVLMKLVKESKIRIVGGYYDLETGCVELVE